MQAFKRHYLLSLLLLLGVAGSGIFAETYAAQNWLPYDSGLPRALPAIREDLKLSKFRSPLAIGDRLVWVYEAPLLRFGLFIWNSRTGAVSYPLELGERIRGMAYDDRTNSLILRTSRSLQFYAADDFTLTKTMAFTNLPNHWNPMTAREGKLHVLVRRDGEVPPEIVCYSLPELRKLTSFSAPKAYVQSLLALPGKELLLWSSYWGRETITVNSDNGNVLRHEQVLSYHFHAMFSAIAWPDGDLRVFDQENGQIGCLRRVNKLWVDVARSEILEGGLAYRFNPVDDHISGSISITAKEDRPASRLALVIPPGTTYAQAISEETILMPGEMVRDALGNRHLLVAIPALKRGETHSAQFYQGKLRRFIVVYDLSALPKDIPANLPLLYREHYLKDSERFQLTHPLVRDHYARLSAGQTSLAGLLQAVYHFTVNEIDGNWDGETEYVPQILANLHGGCTEHAYVSIAFLRKAGLPARFNWHYFGKKEDRKLSFNHKFAEVYIHPIGWLPMEPLGGLRSSAGEIAAYPLVFSVRADLGNSYIKNRDRLGAYLENTESSWNAAPVIIEWILQ